MSQPCPSLCQPAPPPPLPASPPPCLVRRKKKLKPGILSDFLKDEVVPWLINLAGVSPATAYKGIFSKVEALLLADGLIPRTILPPGPDLATKLSTLFTEVRRCGKKGTTLNITFRDDADIDTPCVRAPASPCAARHALPCSPTQPSFTIQAHFLAPLPAPPLPLRRF